MTSRPDLPANTLPPREHDELTALLNALADGGLTEVEERRLREILDRGEPARRVFREFAALHTVLHWDYATLLAPMPPPPSRAAKRGDDRWPPIRRAAAFLSAAAVAGAATAAAWMLMAPAAGPPGQAPKGGSLARVTQARFVLPANGERPLAVGQSLDAGRISLVGGAVELTLRNGVVVVFEGPGEIDLAGELSATLHDGNVVVRMPEGKSGFVVRTPTTDVLDLGTEFAVSVGANNTTDVQVYDGAVITSASRRQEPTRVPRRLVAGEAARFRAEPKAEPVPMAYRPERFVRELPPDVGIPLGRPSATEEMRHYGPARQASIAVHPAPADMIIDGRLDEWADGPGFSGTLDGTPSCPERADGRMMYDEKFLYIAAHVGDPMPLRSIIDPQIDAYWGWRGGAVQVRVSTDRHMGWPARGNSCSYFAQRGIAQPAEARREPHDRGRRRRIRAAAEQLRPGGALRCGRDRQPVRRHEDRHARGHRPAALSQRDRRGEHEVAPGAMCRASLARFGGRHRPARVRRREPRAFRHASHRHRRPRRRPRDDRRDRLRERRLGCRRDHARGRAERRTRRRRHSPRHLPDRHRPVGEGNLHNAPFKRPADGGLHGQLPGRRNRSGLQVKMVPATKSG
jgi:hypothetical protein